MIIFRMMNSGDTTRVLSATYQEFNERAYALRSARNESRGWDYQESYTNSASQVLTFYGSCQYQIPAYTGDMQMNIGKKDERRTGETLSG